MDAEPLFHHLIENIFRFQGHILVIWSPLVGYCYLGVDVQATVLYAGSWDATELGHDEMAGYNLMPHVWGCLTEQVKGTD